MLEYFDPVTLSLIDPTIRRCRWRSDFQDIRLSENILFLDGYPFFAWRHLNVIAAVGSWLQPHHVRVLITDGQQVTLYRTEQPRVVPTHQHWPLSMFLN